MDCPPHAGGAALRDFAIGALQTQNISRSYRVDLVCVILQSPYNKC